MKPDDFDPQLDEPLTPEEQEQMANLKTPSRLSRSLNKD